jgi:hypothetical protein
MFAWSLTTQAQSAYVRVSQVGYEAGETPFRAYQMSSAEGGGAKFKVVDSKGATAFSGHVGPLLGIWSHSQKRAYNVYALDFNAPAGDLYTISVSGPVAAISPRFAVDCPEELYSGLLLNTLFFYETERDGPNLSLTRCARRPDISRITMRTFTRHRGSTATTLSITNRPLRP